jgi:RNA polymerase sigma-70 factor, ECF subfamily
MRVRGRVAGAAVSDLPYNQRRLVDAARSGDQDAFRALTGPWIRELRAHCSKILENPHDADDAVQETLLKAWRKLDSYAGTGPIRAWLYTIATTTSLNLRRARSHHGVAAAVEARLERAAPGADESLAAREDVELAFMSTLSLLPPRQRAALILRDGLGWSALEIARLLGSSMPSVNSALQRARAAIAPVGGEERPCLDPLHQALLSSYVAAWAESDVDRLVTLARADATRTTFIERLRPVGGGWVRVPKNTADGQHELAWRPAFMNA